MRRHILAKKPPKSFFPAAKQTPCQKNVALFFSPKAKQGAAHKKRGAASRTTPTARGEKSGVYEGRIRQRNMSPPIIRPGMNPQESPYGSSDVRGGERHPACVTGGLCIRASKNWENYRSP